MASIPRTSWKWNILLEKPTSWKNERIGKTKNKKLTPFMALLSLLCDASSENNDKF